MAAELPAGDADFRAALSSPSMLDAAPAQTAPAVGGPAVPLYNWYVLGLLCLGCIASNVNRSLLLALAEPIRAEFHLTDTQFGFLAGMAFAVAYSVAGVPVAMLVNRVNRARLIAGLLATWSLITVATGFGSSYLTLLLTRMGVAAAESGGAPTSVSLLGDYFPPAKRGRAVGIFYAQTSAAMIVAFSAAGYLAQAYGWRMVFVLGGLPGLVLSLVFLLTMREPRRGAFDPPHAHDHDASQPGVIEVAKAMAKDKVLASLTLAGGFAVAGQAGISTFCSPFFSRIHHLSLPHASLTVAVIVGGGATLGALAGGFINDHVSKSSPRNGCYVVAALLALSGALASLGFLLPSVPMAIATLFVAQVCLCTYLGAIFPTATLVAPLRIRGAALSFIMLVMNIGGYGFGPQLAGILSDLSKHFGAAEPLRWAMVMMPFTLVVAGFYFYRAGRGLGEGEAAARAC